MGKRILLIGAFDFITYDTGGQQVKSRELYYALCKELGETNITYFETEYWKKRPLRVFFSLIKAIRKYDIIIILPARNGIRIIAPLLLFVKKKRTALYYDVIGGWLPELVANNRYLEKVLKKFDGIWVETMTMKKRLNESHFNNVSIVHNFKTLQRIKKDEMVSFCDFPFPLCTFSRVIPQKGIEDAINAVQLINSKYGFTVYSLDIYGPIGDDYLMRFEGMKKNFPNYIRYCGVVSPSESVRIIKNYYLLLFPTHYYTEGIPGTIIDSFFSGVPVIAPNWLSFNDVLKNGCTGMSYEFGDFDALVSLLEYAKNNTSLFAKMKDNCLKESDLYTVEYNISTIRGLLGIGSAVN